ncbi:MAG: hypothetical protein QM683_04260 [Lacrimispora sp.]
MSWKVRYREWMAYGELDESLRKELSFCKEPELEERFSWDLFFGTGGLGETGSRDQPDECVHGCQSYQGIWGVSAANGGEALLCHCL